MIRISLRPALIGMFALVVASATAAETSGASGGRVPRLAASEADSVVNFSLLDYRGKYYELRRADARVVVLYFVGLDCPIARQSMSKVEALQAEFKTQGVTFWLINSMPQGDPKDRFVEVIGNLAARGVLADLIPRDGPDAENEIRRARVLSNLSGLMPMPLALGDREDLRQQVLISKMGVLPLLRDSDQLVTHYFGVKRTCEAIAIDAKNMTILYRGAIDDQMVPGAQKPKPTENYLHSALAEFLEGKPVANRKTPPQGCLISFDSTPAEREPTYSKQIAPLLQRKCVACHSAGHIGPFALDGYDAVKQWSAMMQEVVLDRRMPPWDADPRFGKFANDRSLAPAEARTLLKWIEQGCDRGEGDDPLAAPAPPAAKWALGEPDFVVKLPSRQSIPATGVLDYRYVDADFVMPQDGWLRAAVCRPDNAKVVHHVIVRVRYPQDYKDIPSESYFISTWAPGVPQGEFPVGTGVFLPKGSRFNFEIHYTTNGEPQTDQSEMGLYLAKEPPKMRLEVRGCECRDLVIPPGEPNAQHSCSYCFKRDAMLYDLGPHMHLRGSWFKFQFLYPDGTRETALSVPHYDFNWQSGHRLAEPKRIPAGTWVICTGGFDNSARNPTNPDPTKQVKFGLQTWDEMFMGFMTVADLPVESGSTSLRTVSAKEQRDADPHQRSGAAAQAKLTPSREN
jgi:AhpC/TSA family